MLEDFPAVVQQALLSNRAPLVHNRLRIVLVKTGWPMVRHPMVYTVLIQMVKIRDLTRFKSIATRPMVGGQFMHRASDEQPICTLDTTAVELIVGPTESRCQIDDSVIRFYDHTIVLMVNMVELRSITI